MSIIPVSSYDEINLKSKGRLSDYCRLYRILEVSRCFLMLIKICMDLIEWKPPGHVCLFFGSLWIFLDKQTHSCDVGIECCPLKAKLFFFFANLWSSNSDNHYFAHFPHKFPPFSYNVTAKECFVSNKFPCCYPQMVVYLFTEAHCQF